MHESSSSELARESARPPALLSRTLILGGARSGKSHYAQRLAERCERERPGLKVVFVATAVAEDDAMRGKIQRHRAERPERWLTIEEPLDLAGIVAGQAQQADLVLIDCLTLYAANLLARHGAATHALDGAVDAFTETLAASPCELVMVSNEVGSGVVPATAIGGKFRDLLGEINQRVAALATDVVLMVAGLPLTLKATPEGSR